VRGLTFKEVFIGSREELINGVLIAEIIKAAP